MKITTAHTIPLHFFFRNVKTFLVHFNVNASLDIYFIQMENLVLIKMSAKIANVTLNEDLASMKKGHINVPAG